MGEREGRAMFNSSVVVFEDELKRINEALEDLLTQSMAKCALLIDSIGHLITSQGDVSRIDTTALASLAAGNFAATKALASLLGESGFSLLFHQGEKENIHLSNISNRTILVVVFDSSVPIGRIRLFVKRAIDKLTQLFESPSYRARREEKLKKIQEVSGSIFGEEFHALADSALDELFKD